jgi:Ser/Thr protein kinase RdoA (MazF antagonist)
VIRDDFTTIEHICAVFGLTAGRRASITPVSRGAVGRIWRLDLGAESFAVKELLRGDAAEGSVRREVAFAAHVAAAGIRRPASLPDRGGRFLARLPERAGGGWLRLYQWIDGESVDLTDPRVPGQIGDLLGRMHASAVPPQGQADSWYETAPGPATWSLLADAGIARGAQWAPALAQHTGRLRELAALVTPPADDQLITCHRDLHPGNVLVDASGGLVLLDWDDVGPAVPGRELARLLIDWHVRDGRADGAAVERTLDAYRAAGGQGRLRDERSFSMHIACLLNFLQAQAGVALDPASVPEHRQYASAEVADTLTRLPTATLIAQLIGQAALILG